MSTVRTRWLVLAASALLFTAACGGTEDDDVSSGDAQQVTKVAWSGMWTASVNISNGLNSASAADDGAPAQQWVTKTGTGEWSIQGTVVNTQGTGEIDVKGTAKLDTTNGYSTTVTLTYKAWTSDGITLDGPITLTLDIAKLLPIDLSSSAKGTLMVKGVVPAIAVPVTVDLTATAKGTTANVCGTVAGFSVAIGTGC